MVYGDAIREALGYRYEIVILETTDEIAAGALLFERSLGPYRWSSPPPFTAYTPILLADQPRETDINHRRSPISAMLEAVEDRYHRLSLLLPPSVSDVRPYSWRNWQVSPLYTYQVPLRDPEQAVREWSKTRRYDYRRHRDEYRIEDRDDNVARVVRLCADSYRRSDRSLPGGVEDIVTLVETLCSREAARVFTAVNKASNEPEAGIITLCEGTTAYYWLAGSIPGPAMTVLLGRVCERLYEEEYSTLDLVGANTPSIAEFKRRFGSKLMPYYHAERILRSELRLLDYLRRFR